MMKKQGGFTLIELVAVIVILGALAVVALPRFVDLQDEAEQAAAEGVAGAVSAAFATNYAASLTKDNSESWGTEAGPNSYTIVDTNSDITNLSDVNALMTGNPLNADDYTISGCAASDFSDAGATEDCVLQDGDGSTFSPTVSFTAIATS